MTSDEKYSDPWKESLTAEQQIHYRVPVPLLNENAVTNLICEFEKYIAQKNLAGIYSLFSLDLEATLYIVVNNEIKSHNVDRDACCYSFYSYVNQSNTKNYRMEIKETTKINPEKYQIKLQLSHFGNNDVEKVYGKIARCMADVVLYKNVPVISKFIMEPNNE